MLTLNTELQYKKSQYERSSAKNSLNFELCDAHCSVRDCIYQFIYTVVMLLTFILIIVSIPSPTHSFILDFKPSFLQVLPTVAFLSAPGLTTWIPQTVYSYF